MFKDKSAKMLIASDVAARGIDIDGLSHVFNYDVPNNPKIMFIVSVVLEEQANKVKHIHFLMIMTIKRLY